MAPVNDAPVANGNTLAATEDTAITYLATDLLGNDTDLEGDTLAIASVTSGTGGTVVLNADGTVTFTPTPNFNGAASFSYIATDGSLQSNSASVTVNVAPVNDAPVANSNTLAATEDTAITYLAADLLGNDTDLEGDTLSIASVTSGTGGTVVLNADGTVTFTPSAQLQRRGELQLHRHRWQPAIQQRQRHRQRGPGQRCPGGQRQHPGGHRRHRRHLHWQRTCWATTPIWRATTLCASPASPAARAARSCSMPTAR